MKRLHILICLLIAGITRAEIPYPSALDKAAGKDGNTLILFRGDNLSAAPAHAETLKRMQGLLHEWQVETRDPFLDPAVLAAKHVEVNKKPGSPTPDSE